eukprot:GEMP01022028.1.p1 GENE.GEMP01022028.1~~GEMP01022028.1.p1  ORF type:complete len:304 (+),score=66.05 GEMP01022028.1:422-1333(+)
MATVRFANAPCSWGSLEFEEAKPANFCYRMLDELQQAGFAGSELGDYGFMPTDPARLKNEIHRRKLHMIGAFCAYALWDPQAYEKGRAYARKVGKLLSAFKDQPFPPHLVLSDDVSVQERIDNTGRIEASMRLSLEKWKNLVDEVAFVKKMMMDEFGVAVYFHPHCGSYIETPHEIVTLLRHTDVNMVFDTGHIAMGANDPSAVMDLLTRFPQRIHTFHFKDFDPAQLAKGGNYFDLIGRGVFCELGKGCVDFQKVKEWQEQRKYDGWLVVEQDVLPGMGKPFDSARRNFAFLQNLYGTPSKL